MPLRTVLFVQQHAKLWLGIYEHKLGVGRTGRVGEVGCCRCGVALALRDRLADCAVCFPGRLLAGLVAVVCILTARATESGSLAGAGGAGCNGLLAFRSVNVRRAEVVRCCGHQVVGIVALQLITLVPKGVMDRVPAEWCITYVWKRMQMRSSDFQSKLLDAEN